MNTSRSIVEVGVAMVLKDRFSQEAGKISGSFRTMMNDMNTLRVFRMKFGLLRKLLVLPLQNKEKCYNWQKMSMR